MYLRVCVYLVGKNAMGGRYNLFEMYGKQLTLFAQRGVMLNACVI